MGLLKTTHVVSFAVFGVAVSIHALAHLRRVPALAGGDWRRAGGGVPRRLARTALVGVALVAGLTMAVQTDGARVH